MNIALIGTGYVGLVTGACLAEVGHRVTCVDIDQAKINSLQKGEIPIYENNLEELVKKNLKRGNLHFTTNHEKGLAGKSVIILAVGTPQKTDGSADLSAVFSASEAIARHIHTGTVIITKSTVPIGTNQQIKQYVSQKSPESIQIKIASCPEFLRQGTAVHDMFNGDRIVIGSEDASTAAIVEQIYEPFNIPIIKTDLKSAEMIKYAANAFLAAKISFINEIARLCEGSGANVEDVAEGIGMDRRIGKHFLKAGSGFGGSCFPKDLSEIIAFGRKNDTRMSMLETVQDVNRRQTKLLAEKLKKRFSVLKGKTVAVLGLAFKPGTDDMRNAPSINLITELHRAGARVIAFDPAASESAAHVLPKTTRFAGSISEALKDADCAVILTDWDAIKHYPLESYKNLLKTPIIVDGRNCFALKNLKGTGIEYYSVGRPAIIPHEMGCLS